MASIVAFGTVVSARVRTATYLLTTPGLLTRFEHHGGLKSDLEKIRDAGRDAETFNMLQGGGQADGKAATKDVLDRFRDVQHRYKGVMAVTEAVLADLEEGGVAPEIIARLKKILLNEAPVIIRTPDGEGSKRRAVRVKSQEGIRAEIEKDVRSLIDLAAVHGAFAARKVPVSALEALRADAAALSGKLAERAARKGASKSLSQQEKAAVNAQKKRWASTYRILARVALEDPAVAQLLREAKA